MTATQSQPITEARGFQPRRCCRDSWASFKGAKKMIFYRMGNDNFVSAGLRGTTVRAIKKLQSQEWARKQGGICEVVKLTEPRAIYFAQNKKSN